MQHSMKLLMAQINPTVGAIEKNTDRIIQIIQENQTNHELIVFPELAITGYPPEDLLLRNELFTRVQKALNRITKITKCHVVLGHPSLIEGKCYNSASIIYNHQCVVLYHKHHLPNYGVFDEKRYFSSASFTPCVFKIKNHRFGVLICEDVWSMGPIDQLITAGIDTLLIINASPFEYDKPEFREKLLKPYAKQGIKIIYVNQVGGQDELIFDGQSFALNLQGELCARAPAFCESLLSLNLEEKQIKGAITPNLDKPALIYQALTCGLRDYVEKNSFSGVLLGLSGGVDSALTLAIAADALGPSRVHAVLMPSRYTAEISNVDALEQLNTLGVSYSNLPIESVFNSLLTTLTPEFQGLPPDTTEENLQARIRGVLLMALSNKTGKMVLATSNKSESAVGYATLYGDMCGGLSVLKDVLKTTVYELAHYRNSISPVIPERVLTRAPSAELAPNQTDQDTLPDYPTLDAIIELYMVKKLSAEEIIQQGYTKETVHRIIKMIKRNEYKRRQAAPGLKITQCAFGRDWRYPITSGF